MVTATQNNDYSGIAKCLLHIPARSGPSKRVFSVAGDIVRATKNCFNLDIVGMLVFLKQNLGTGTNDYTLTITYLLGSATCVNCKQFWY